MIGPDAIGGGTKDDCDGDKIKNKVDTDDDNDLIPDTLEATLGTNPCARDTDGDGESDGWEYYSALDRNGNAKPAPFAKPYPNPLDGKDADIDHDGDGLTDIQEYAAWASFGANKLPLSYSRRQPGLGRPRRARRPAWPTWTATATASSATSSATPTATASRTWTRAAPKDGARITKAQPADDTELLRLRALHAVLHRARREAEQGSDEPLCQGINQVPFYCVDSLTKARSTSRRSTRSTGCRPTPTATASATTPTTPTTTTSRTSRSTCRRSPRRSSDRKYRQLDACVPNVDSRFCLLGSADVDRDGIPNRDDTDDDGDGLPDTLEQRATGLDPLRADSDSDGVSDGFEYWSALDLNGAAAPVPGQGALPQRARRQRRRASTSTATASRSRRSTRPGTTRGARSR